MWIVIYLLNTFWKIYNLTLQPFACIFAFDKQFNLKEEVYEKGMDSKEGTIPTKKKKPSNLTYRPTSTWATGWSSPSGKRNRSTRAIEMPISDPTSIDLQFLFPPGDDRWYGVPRNNNLGTIIQNMQCNLGTHELDNLLGPKFISLVLEKF
jgi:hypothetical protein